MTDNTNDNYQDFPRCPHCNRELNIHTNAMSTSEAGIKYHYICEYCGRVFGITVGIHRVYAVYKLVKTGLINLV